MATKDPWDDLTDRLIEQAFCELAVVSNHKVGQDLYNHWRLSSYPTLPRRLKPLWTHLKPKLLKINCRSLAMLRSKVRRQVGAQAIWSKDGYTQSPLL
jgi:hypothetical protein